MHLSLDIKDVIKKEWETTRMTFNELSDKHNVPASTIKSWKARDKKRGEEWFRETTASDKKKMQKKKIQKEVAKLSDDLNDQQKLFCIYYIKYFNATKAYQKVYGCEYTTAMSNGSKALRNTKIRAEIERLKAERMGNYLIDADDILRKYIDIAFADIEDFVDVEVVEKPLLDDYGEPVLDDDGNPVIQKYNRVLAKEGDSFDGTLVTSISQGRDGLKINLADKMRALDSLSRYFDIGGDTNFSRAIEQEKLAVAKARVGMEKAAEEKTNQYQDLTLEELRRLANGNTN